MAALKKMDRAEYQNELLRLAQVFVKADQEREAAAQQMREAEGRKAGAAQEIRLLVPHRGEEFLRALESPPDLCQECGSPSGYCAPLCWPCREKAQKREETERVEARAKELLAEQLRTQSEGQLVKT